MAIQQDFNTASKALLDALAKIAPIVAQVDAIETVLHGHQVPPASSPAAQPPAGTSPPPPGPSAPPVLPPAVVTPAPITSILTPVITVQPGPAGYINRAIKSTIWRNKADEGVDPAAASSGLVFHNGDGLIQQVVSLPAPYERGRVVWLQLCDDVGNPLGPWVGPFAQADTGPWRLHDLYWRSHTRPVAESLSGKILVWNSGVGWVPGTGSDELTGNGSGLDCTPATASQVLAAHMGKTAAAIAQQLYTNPTEFYVNMVVVESSTNPAATPAAPAVKTRADVVARAIAAESLGIRYRIGWGGKNPVGDHPGQLDPQDGILYSDCSGFVDNCFGFSRDSSGLNTDAQVADAEGPEKYFDEIQPGSALAGDCMTYAKQPGHNYGHTCIVKTVEAGVPKTVIDCSSMNPVTNAIAEKGPEIFTKYNAKILRLRRLTA